MEAQPLRSTLLLIFRRGCRHLISIPLSSVRLFPPSSPRHAARSFHLPLLPHLLLLLILSLVVLLLSLLVLRIVPPGSLQRGHLPALGTRHPVTRRTVIRTPKSSADKKDDKVEKECGLPERSEAKNNKMGRKNERDPKLKSAARHNVAAV